ncbi:MAG TPA: cytochrome b5-like heme/steroid binding domain-containing protein [Parcubacteria group bacterium]|nr:cytochrome b5-like heme/steroid binding domain-containing protein [Parcubacteria group bacterium]
MHNKFIPVIIGLVVAASTGIFVQSTKNPSIPNQVPTSDEVTANYSSSKTLYNYDEDEDEDDDDGVSGSTVSTPATEATSATPQGTTPSTGGITLAQISSHSSRSSCWSAINGVVYDLTSWIPNHPGGEGTILGLCGRDGTQSYNGQHGGKTKIFNILTGFKIGTLAQ